MSLLHTERKKVYKAIRDARSTLPRTEYNKMMRELEDVARFQVSMTSTEERYKQLMIAIEENNK